MMKYRHYKGGEYELIGEALHTETLEEVVVYKSLQSNTEFQKNTMWVRSAQMFFSMVEYKGSRVARFEAIE